MSRVLVILAFVLASTFGANAQQFGFVDTESVLQKMPAYEQAQEQLNGIAEGWKKEIEQRYKQIDQMYRQFQAEQVLLTETERAQREEEIVNAEREAREFQKSKFGTNGTLNQKRQELVKPVQDEVYAAVQSVAKKKRLDFIFDRGGGMAMLYANPDFDYTEDVMRELNLR